MVSQKHKKMKWYAFYAPAYKLGMLRTVDIIYVYLVEGTSKINIYDIYGRHRKNGYKDAAGRLVYFPRSTNEIKVMPISWTPNQPIPPDHMPAHNSKVIIRYANTFLCSCGERYQSEYSFSYIHCKCGDKAHFRKRGQQNGCKSTFS